MESARFVRRYLDERNRRRELAAVFVVAAGFVACGRSELKLPSAMDGAASGPGGSMASGGTGATAHGGSSAGAGQSAGGAGTGGSSGSAGASDGGAPDCDDAEPCTDDRVQDNRCRHVAVKDGTICDDRNVCTQGDRCLGGHCEGGAPVTGSPEVISVSAPSFRGQGLGVGKDRFLFRSPQSDPERTLTLARVNGDTFESLDQIKASIGGAFWIADDLVAYTSDHAGGLIDLSGDKLRLRGRFDAGAAQPAHFAFTPGRLWVCLAGGSADLLPFQIINLDTLVPIRQGISLPGGCKALAPSGDGKQVYVSAGENTLIVAPQGDGDPVIAGALGLPSHSVHVRHGYIALSDPAAAVVLRESDHVEVARLDALVSNCRVTTRGLEVIDYETNAGVTDLVFAVYQIDEGADEPLKLRGKQVLTTLGGAVTPQPSVWASYDDALMNEPHVYRLNDEPPFLSEIRDPDLAWPGWLRVEGSAIYLRDALRAVKVDVQDRAHPKATFGGPFPAALEGASLEIPQAAELALFGDPSLDDAHTRTRLLATLGDVHLRSFDAAQRPVEGSLLELGPEAGDTWVTQRKLYQLLHASAPPWPSFRLLRWDADALQSSPLARPELDQSIDAPPGHELSSLARIHGDDATAFSTRVGASGASDVYWTSLGSDPQLAGPLSLGWSPWDLAIHGERVVVMGFAAGSGGKLNVTFVSAERRKDRLVELNRISWATPIESDTALVSQYPAQQLLGFDGQVAYAQLAFGTQAAPGPAVVGVLFGVSAVPPVAYPLQTNGALWSFSMSDVGLVFARPNALYVARPWCQ
jgi:hypothetical protein